MSYYSQTRTSVNTDDTTEFVSWGQFLSDSMTSIGWTKTSDTGQIDWGTATKPGTINTTAGYEIRKSPTKSSYQDLYVKIEYGVGSNIAYASLWFTFGTASDGAGTLTGITSSRYQKANAANTNACEDLISGGDDWLACQHSIATNAANSSGGLFVFERLLDADGNPQTDGWAIVINANNNPHTLSLDDSAIGDVQSDYIVGYFPAGSSGGTGVTFVAPEMPNRPDAHYPMRALAWVGISKSGQGTNPTFAMYPNKSQAWRGTYMQAAVSYFSLSLAPENLSPLIRWD